MSDGIQQNEVEAEIVDVAEFLSLRLLARDAKVRVSDAFDATEWAGNSSLFAVSNKLGWFVAGTPNGLVASSLSHLRGRETSATGAGPVELEPQQRITLSGAPFFVNFATSHTKVVVVVEAEGLWYIDVFNSEDVCKQDSDAVKPVHTFPLGKEVVVDMQPNPSEGSEIVALLRGRKSSKSCLDMINVVTASRVTSWGAASVIDESATFTCLSWSVRGKQIVVGTRGGQLAQFTPEGERKQTIAPPPSHSPPQAAVSVLWLENTVFHVVYGNPMSDPSDPTHEYEVYNIIYDSKAKTASYIKFTDPAPPFGLASRLSCRHYVRLAGWEPTKHLIFVADGPSTDVGIVGCLNSSEASGKATPWATLEVDETSRVALPMDEELNETSIMGLDLDLTSTEPINNSKEAGDGALPSPPSPVLHLYTSAGLIISYHVLNAREGQYPGMDVTAESVVSPRPATPPSAIANKPTAFAGFGTSSGAFGATNTPKPSGAFSLTPATPAFGAPSFGTTTPAGAPAFGVSGFDTSTTPARPAITFGQPSTTPASTTPAFGQTSAFGNTSAFGSGFGKFASTPAGLGSTTPAGTPAPGGGFASFSTKPSGFGGSGSTTPAATPDTAAPKQGGFGGFGSSVFGAGSTTPKSGGAFSGFGSSAFATPSPASTPKAEVKLRAEDVDQESPIAAKSPLPMDDEVVSPPGSPGEASDEELDVDTLSLGGTKKPPPGISFSDDEDEHDPTETPSKPPTTTTSFAGFGKPSAFGSTAASGSFGAATTAKPNAGFGAFGTKSSVPSAGFGFGTSASKPEGEAAKPAFGGGSGFGSPSAFGSTPAFGTASGFGTTTAFGSAAKPASTAGGVAFGATSSLGATSAPKFGATSAFGVSTTTPTPASPAPNSTEAPKSGGFAAFAAKPSETKSGGGFAGFGDASKGGFASFSKPGEAKSGGFGGFGGQAKKTEEKPLGNSGDGVADSKEGEVKDERPATPKSDKASEDIKDANEVKAPAKSAFGLLVSSPPPKPKAPSTTPESFKPSSEIQSKIPVPKAGSLSGLSPKPEPSQSSPAEDAGNALLQVPTPARAQSTTPPGSPVPDQPPSPPTSVPLKPVVPVPSAPIGLGRPQARAPFNSAPMRSSPLASPPVTREDQAKQEEFAKAAPVNPPALAPKAPSSFGVPSSSPSPSGAPTPGAKTASPFTAPSSLSLGAPSPSFAAAPNSTTAKPAGTGFFGFGFGKPAAAESKDKDSKPQAEQWPSSFTGAMKGVGPASVTSGSPAVSAPSASTPAPGASKPTPSVPGSLFGTPAPSTAPPFSFGGSAPTAPAVPASASPFSAPPPKPASPSLFSVPASSGAPPTSTPAPSASAFSTFKPSATPVPVPATPAAASSVTPPAPQTPLSNVEVEFNKLLEQMSTELKKFRQDTTALREKHAQISRGNIPPPASIQSAATPSKWRLGDLTALKQVTGLVGREVVQLEGLNKDFASQMIELQPGAEKVQAKRNEIARYIKAKKDPKYTRLLKSRTSSPEHVESQTKLRKSIQIVRERTRQLEDFMATQKSRIQKQKEGKRDFKVPSIDTINRTMRNIDAALAQKSDEISALVTRVDRMKLKAPRRKPSANGGAPLALLPAENEKIKLASAAALNMERTSIRLKNALLQARTETPLNVSAVGAPVETKPAALAKVLPPPVPAPAIAPAPSTSTPIPLPVFKQPATPISFAPASKPAAPATPTFVLPATPVALPGFSPLGKDEFHVTAGYEHSSRRADKARMHGPSAKLKTPSPNISRTSTVAPVVVEKPTTPLPPLVPTAKSFFGATAPVAVQPGRNPVPFSFASFGSPSLGGGATTGSTPPAGFSFFQTPAQKAASGASTSTTPALPPIPKWGLPNFGSPSSVSSQGSKRDTPKKEANSDEEDGEGHAGEEGEEDDEEDDDWAPEDDDDEDDDDEDVSDGVPEGEENEDEDQTV